MKPRTPAVRALTSGAPRRRARFGHALALTALAGAALVATAVSVALNPASAKASGPPVNSSLTTTNAPVTVVSANITGSALDKSLNANQKDNPDFLREIVGQVDWLTGRHGDPAPKAVDKLGPKYVLLLTYSDGKKTEYDLYPYSPSGPYIYYPSPQPGNRKVTAAWYIGRLSMVDVFCDQGVSPPGSDACKLVAQGQGGGAGEVLNNQIGSGLGHWRQSIYAIGGGAGLIGVLIFMITLRTHRRTG
jgi:hypothetical protein